MGLLVQELRVLPVKRTYENFKIKIRDFFINMLKNEDDIIDFILFVP